MEEAGGSVTVHLQKGKSKSRTKEHDEDLGSREKSKPTVQFSISVSGELTLRISEQKTERLA